MAGKIEKQLHKARQTQHRLLFLTHQMAHRVKQKKLKTQMSMNKFRLEIRVKF